VQENYGLWAKLVLLTVCASKYFWNTAKVVCLASSMAAFTLQWQYRIVVTMTTSSIKSKMFTIWNFTGKVYALLPLRNYGNQRKSERERERELLIISIFFVFQVPICIIQGPYKCATQTSYNREPRWLKDLTPANLKFSNEFDPKWYPPQTTSHLWLSVARMPMEIHC
jgi:hypothetical protein